MNARSKELLDRAIAAKDQQIDALICTRDRSAEVKINLYKGTR